MADIVHESLVTELNNVRGGIRLGHINMNGLRNKLVEVSILLLETKFDVFAVTETHLTKDISNNEISIPGYSICRKDRDNGKKWGGCLVYYSDALNVLSTDFSNLCKSTESVWLDVRLHSLNILIGCVYRPPNENKFIANFTPVLESLSSKRKNIVILGDFNIDLSINRSSNADSSLINNFKNLLYCFNLQNLITKPTRVTYSSSSLIDHLIISKNLRHNSFVKSSGCYDPCISDHHLIYTVLNLIKPKRLPKFITVTKCIDEPALVKEFESVPSQVCSVFDDIDDTLWCWNQLYNNALSEHLLE